MWDGAKGSGGNNMWGQSGGYGGSGHPTWGPGKQIYGGGDGGSTWPSSPSGPGWNNPPAGPSPGGWSNPPAGRAMNLKIPFTANLQHGVRDKVITIKATVKSDGSKFAVDLCKGADIAFHFKPYLDQNKIIVNTFCAGKWGKEERAGSFPFAKGQYFEMKIRCTADCYDVAINGTHLMKYNHRIKDLGAIRSIGIYEDLTLTEFECS